MDSKPRVFLSYSHRDQELAREIKQALLAHGILCWMDDALVSGDQWDTKIRDAIPNSRMLIVLISANADAKPEQIKRELAIAGNFQVPIFPLFVIHPRECRELGYRFASTQSYRMIDPAMPLDESLDRFVEDLQVAMAHHERERRRRQQQAPRPVNAAEPAGFAPPSPPPAPTPPAADRYAPAPVAAPDRYSPPPPPPTEEFSAAPARPASATAPARGPAQSAGNGAPARRVSLLYRRRAQPDETLLAYLEKNLAQRGYEVFHDRDLKPGSEWFRAIERKIKESDAIIPLISAASLDSEMLTAELTIARETREACAQEPRRPMIFPIRVAFEGRLTGDLGLTLDSFQYLLWQSEADNERLLAELLSALEGKKPVEPKQIERPGGAMPVDSPLYIERRTDLEFRTALAREDTIMLVKGARQMGKTSLIARGLTEARQAGHRVAVTDLQRLNNDDFADLRRFYTALGDILADALDVDETLGETWKDDRAPNVNFERFVRGLLKASPARLVWAIDETDRLFPTAFGTEVFGLFRSWHNARQLDPTGRWQQLSLVIGYATEAALFIKDVNMSPFNVGTLIELRDFNLAEIGLLNERHGRPLKTEAELTKLHELVGGQPFLLRRCLYALAVDRTPFAELVATAGKDEGIFGDHLRRFAMLLHKDPDLETAVKHLVKGGANVLGSDEFYRLRSAGLLKGESRHDAAMRCAIYADYLRGHF